MEKYIQGRMTADQKEQFEGEMAQNQELQDELVIHRKLINSIETESVRQLLEQIHDENFNQETPVVSLQSRSRRLSLAIAASVAIIAVAVWWVFNWQTSQPKALYAAYFEPAQGLPTTLGYADQQQFAEGMISYKLGDYSEAIAYWQPLVNSDPANDTLNYYLGIAALADEAPGQAINYLEKVEQAYFISARWYLALAFLQQEEPQAAVPILKNLAAQETTYQAESQAILKKLD